ncbi:MAG: ABC transporter substrate-binding protein [Acidobacteria bacterium]|nr:ABC transporter substrate-binding protein [Acidobacteriota bacterium]
MIRTPAALFAALALVAAACTALDSTSPAPDGSAGFPITIDAPSGPVTVDARPTKIVSLSPTATEILFAIEAGDQVVAVDDQSNYPEDAPVTDMTGFSPNIEAIAALGADLVVLGFDPGEVVAALDAVGIPAIVHPAAVDLDDAYTQIEQLGAATGHVAEAAAVVAGMRENIARIAGETDAGGATYYHELDPTLYSATSATFAGAIYGMLGLVNIADAAPDPDGFGYPQLSPEHIVSEDPDLVFLADTKCCGQNTATVADRPGWNTMRAVQRGTIVELDDDVASRWGPRVVEFMETVAAAIGALVDG